MCRTHIITFLSCGHHENEATRLFSCLNPGQNCSRKTISHELNRFCTSCFFDHVSGRSPQLTAGRRHSEIPGPVVDSGPSIPDAETVQHARNQSTIYEFSEPLSHEDATWLKSIEHNVNSAIWIWFLTPTDEDNPAPIPDPTFEDLLMYMQIRKAMLAQIIRQSEARITNRVRASAGLAAILTPVLVPRDPTCSICKEKFEELGEDGMLIESAVKLRCNHEFRSRCFEMWAGAWEPSTDFTVSCPECRRVFVLMPRDELPASPRWLRLLREAWSF